VQGPAGISFKGIWSASTGYLANDAVFYGGSTYLALATNLGVQPDVTPAAWAMLAQSGSAGATGPAGAAATVSIGTVTTGAAGTQATVTNSGSSNAAVLNFYYSVNNSNGSTTETAPALTWVPDGCVATKLVVFSQQSNTVTVTLRSGAAASMADTALSCVVASGTSCTVTGSVAIAPQSFVDLYIHGASGTSAGVWTAVACD
jgi:hypothetical protein